MAMNDKFLIIVGHGHWNGRFQVFITVMNPTQALPWCHAIIITVVTLLVVLVVVKTHNQPHPSVQPQPLIFAANPGLVSINLDGGWWLVPGSVSTIWTPHRKWNSVYISISCWIASIYGNNWCVCHCHAELIHLSCFSPHAWLVEMLSTLVKTCKIRIQLQVIISNLILCFKN